jgi:hypothetical protein
MLGILEQLYVATGAAALVRLLTLA